MSKRTIRFSLSFLVISQLAIAFDTAQQAEAQTGQQTNDAAPRSKIMRPVAAAKAAAMSQVNAAKKASQALNPVNAAKAAKEKITKTLTPEPTTQPVRDKWALLVGLEAFNDNSLRPVKNAQQNAVLMSSFLASPDLGKFGPSRCVIVTNNKATKNNVSKALGETWLLKNALPNDLVLLYFSTRAQWNADHSDVLLYMFDTPASQPALGSISLKETLTQLRTRTQSKQILCLLDCAPVVKQKSESDDAADEAAQPAAPVGEDAMTLEKIAEESGTTILSANDIGGKSYPSSTKPCSAFVEQLLEGMAVSNGNVEFDQVAQYVKRMVQERVAADFKKEQIPVLATAEDTSDTMLKTIVGVAVKSSTPEKPHKFGHPPERAPEAVARTAQTSKAAGTSTTRSAPKTASNKKDDEEEEYNFDGNVDFGPYMAKMKKDIQAKWKPPKGFNSQKVVAVFSIKKDGTIANASIADGSGSEVVDKSAMEALEAASPLDPLPQGSPPYVQIRYQFDWTVTKN